MRKVILFLGTGIMISCILPSCKKSYNCECIDVQGEITTRNVIAASKTEAQKNCDEYGLRGHCEIK